MQFKFNKQNLLIGAGVLVISYVFYLLLKKKKMNPIFVEGNYKGANCDELHAFQSTHGKTIGDMNTKVNSELERVYAQGINPEVTDVQVQMNASTMTVNWKVKIEQSKDGKAWVGFTSRGSSGPSAFTRANGKSSGQDFDTILKHVRQVKGEPQAEMKLVKDFLSNLDTNGKSTGKCPTRQLFYSYTRPSKLPKH